MALNFLGLGFSFGAKDKGAIRATESLQSGFSGITKAVEGIGSAVASLKFGNLLKGLQIGQLNDLADKMSGLTDASTNLSTGLESMAASNTKSAKALGTQLGYTGKALSQFASQASSMAISLNIDANAAGKALQTFDWAGKEFAAIGLKSAQDVAKFGEVVGADVSQLAVQLRRMREQFQFSDEDMKGFVGGLHALGTEAAQIPEMMAQIPNVLSVLGEVTDSTGKKLKGADLANFAKETTALARGFYASGQDAEKAMESALGLARTLAETRESYHQMFTGVGSELPQLLTQLGIATGDVNHAFEMMQQGPEGFTTGMAELVHSATKSGADVGKVMAIMRGRMKEAGFPAETVDSIEEFFEKADEGVLKAMSDVRNASTDMGKLAREGFSTGRTLAESFEMAEEAFILRFRNISRKEAVQFVGDTTKQFDIFAGKLEKIAAEGGPLGAIVKRFALVHQIGGKALLPQTLRPIAQMFGEMAGAAGPALGIMGQLGFRISHLASPLALLGAALAPLLIWFADLAMRAKDVGNFFDLMTEDVQNFANNALNYLFKSMTELEKWASDFDFAKFFDRIFKSLESFSMEGGGGIDFIGMIFGDPKEGETGASEKINKVVSSLVTVFDKVWTALGDAAAKVDWGKVLGNTLDALVTVFLEWPNKLFHYFLDMDWAGAVIGMIEGMAAAFADVGTGGGTGFDFGSLFMKLFGNLADMSTRVYQVFWKILTTAFDTLGKVDWATVASNVWTGLTNIFGGLSTKVVDVLSEVVRSIPEVIGLVTSTLDWGAAKLDGASEWVSGLMDTLGDYVRQGADYLWENVPKWLGEAFDKVSDWFSEIDWVEMAKSLGESMLNGLVSIETFLAKLRIKALGFIVSAVTWIAEKIPEVLDKVVPAITEFFEGLPKMIEDALSGEGGGGAGSFFGDMIGKWLGALKTLWPVLVAAFTKLVPALFKALVAVIKANYTVLFKVLPTIAVALIEVVKVLVVKLVSWVPNFLGGLLEKAWEFMGPYFLDILDMVSAATEKTFEYVEKTIKDVVSSITGGFENFYKKVVGWFRSLRSSIGSVMSWLVGVWDTVKDKWITATGGIQTKLDEWVGWFRGIWEEIRSKATDVGDSLLKPWERVSEVMSSFRDKAKDFFKPFVSSAISFGEMLIGKFRSIVRKLSEFMLSVYEKIADLNKKSPVKFMKPAEVEATTKALRAMASASSEVSVATATVSRELADKFPKAFALIGSFHRDVSNEIASQQNALVEFQRRLSVYESSLPSVGQRTGDQIGKLNELQKAVKGTETYIRRLTEGLNSGEAKEAYSKIAKDTDNASTALSTMRISMQKLREEVFRTVGNSIQWDWDEAMNVMKSASSLSTGGMDQLSMAMAKTSDTAADSIAKIGEGNMGSGLLADANEVAKQLGVVTSEMTKDTLRAQSLLRERSAQGAKNREEQSKIESRTVSLVDAINNPDWVQAELVPIRRLVEEVVLGLKDTRKRAPSATEGAPARPDNPKRSLIDNSRFSLPRGIG